LSPAARGPHARGPAAHGGRRIALVAALSLLLVFALRVALYRPLAVVGEDPRDGFVRVPGIVHVHTTLSDGGGTPEEVIRAARAAGLRFVILTDHNNLDAKPFEGYRDGVLVVVGTELSTTAGHLLGLGVDDPPYRFSGDARDGLQDIRDLGGFSFAAHPLSPRDDLRFTGWDLPGPWGLELVNGDSEWRRAGPRILLTAALYGLNHRYALLRGMNSADPMLARWDELLARRDVVGIAGADAHSRIPLTKTRALRFPSYESVFSLQRNHVLLPSPLTGELDSDRRAVLEALRQGRLYLGLDALAPADSISFVAEAGGQRFTMGDTAPPLAGLRLEASGRWPESARASILRDGKRLAEGAGPLRTEVPGPGVYRLEIHVPGAQVPWVIANPIYVFDEAAREQRVRSAAWPTPKEVPATVQLLDDFEGASAFHPGADARSSARADVFDPRGGRDGKGAARLHFRIGEPTPDHPHVFAALVDRTHRDLQGRKGLAFSLRADGEYRVWVQVRDENLASPDEGTEWWFASIKTSPEWQRVALPFSRLRSINPRTDGRLDLEKVRAIVFVLDRGSVRPGARGTIWLDDLGVY
jgi:hypothetical protein